MPSLAVHLSADDVRRTHLKIFYDPEQPYDARESPQETLREILNARSGDITRLLRTVQLETEQTVPQAWSYHMAIWAGLHIWPDANHRTALYTFNMAARKALGLYVGLPELASRVITRASKEMRKAAGGYALADLTDPSHPYRRLWSLAEAALVIRRVDR